MPSNDIQPITLYLKQNIIQHSFALKAKSSLRKLTVKFQCSYKKPEKKSIYITKENKHIFKITDSWDEIPYSSMKVHQSFGRKYWFQFMRQRICKKQGMKFCRTTSCNMSEDNAHIHHFRIPKL